VTTLGRCMSTGATPTIARAARPRRDRGELFGELSDLSRPPARALLALACLAYALLCAALLVASPYAGALAALLPALAACLLAASSGSAAVRARCAGAAWLLLLAAACPWQTLSVSAEGAVGAGSANAAKLAITALALALAFLLRVPRARYAPHVKALLAYAALAALGGALGAEPGSSALRAVRFAMVVIAIVWLSGRISPWRAASLLCAFAAGVSLLALLARAGGLPGTRVYGARLDGCLPPLHPNELGLIAAAGLLCACALLARGRLSRARFAPAATVLLAALVLTQSRTSMIALVLGLIAFALPRLASRGPVVASLLALALLLGAFVQTNTESRPLDALLTHNGSTTTTGTLGSRVSEWRSVLRQNGTAASAAVGRGLAAKSVSVELASARYAPVDGSWPAAYLSAGIAGLLALAWAVAASARAALRRRDDLALAAVVFLLVSSLVADVFNDVTVGLVMLLSIGAASLAEAAGRPSPAAR
jgi:O-antigen ligase/polysaccharide polymerase Wzy-like membrane protein